MATKPTLKIDGKSFTTKRLAKALALQEAEGDLKVKDFLKDLKEETDKALAEEETNNK